MLSKTNLMFAFRRKTCFVFVAYYFLISVTATAQNIEELGVDSAFTIARQLAFSGKREEGRQLALRLIQKHPNYLELKTFVGRTYAWDGKYDEARKLFADVAAADANTLDNYLAWSDTERWADEPGKNLSVLDQALLHFKDEPELLYRKARLLSMSGRLADAKQLVQKAIRQQPNHSDAYKLLQELRSQLLDNSVSVGFSHEEFSKFYSSTNTAYVQASRITPIGSVIGRVNYANRFGKQALQPEVDLYPRLFRGTYAYLNAGFSAGSLFPDQRYGAEIFASLPKSFEVSAGARYLNFGPQSKVTIYTGSVGYYTGNYWLSVRPYITPDSARSSTSASLTVRRYFRNPEHYFSVRIGAGISPELLNTQTAAGIYTKEFYGLRSQSLSLNYQQPVSKHIIVNGGLGMGRQEALFAVGEFSNSLNVSLSLKYRCK